MRLPAISKSRASTNDKKEFEIKFHGGMLDVYMIDIESKGVSSIDNKLVELSAVSQVDRITPCLR